MHICKHKNIVIRPALKKNPKKIAPQRHFFSEMLTRTKNVNLFGLKPQSDERLRLPTTCDYLRPAVIVGSLDGDHRATIGDLVQTTKDLLRLGIYIPTKRG